MGPAAGAMAGAAISAGGELLGGLMSAKANQKQLDRQLMHNYRAQKEFLQNQLQWQVSDAHRAGLHPLFALGGNAATFSPGAVTIGGENAGTAVARAGQHIGRAVAAQETEEQRAITTAQLKVLEAQAEKDFAIASAYRSVRARQPGGPPAPDMGDPAGLVGFGAGGNHAADATITHQGVPNIPQGIPGAMDRRTIKPSETVSASSNDLSSEAASGVAWKPYRMNDRGFIMDLPAGSSMSEALESMSESRVIMGVVVMRNIQKYGWEWLREFANFAPELAAGRSY